MVANGCYGRTFQELFPQTKEMTLDTFLDQWYKGMFLSLKMDGRTQESAFPKMETESWSGGCWTLNTLESLNDAVESSLYSILEHGGGTRRYCLSPKACEGILRRAKERGKVLPKALEETLEKMTSVPNGVGYKVTGAMCAVDRKGIGNQYVDQGKVVMEPKTMDVISWKERDRLAPIVNNMTGSLAASDYKGPSFVGYMEKTEDGHDS